MTKKIILIIVIIILGLACLKLFNHAILKQVQNDVKANGTVVFWTLQLGTFDNYINSVIKEFEKEIQIPVNVDPNGHLMGALGVAVLCKAEKKETHFDFNITDINFETKGVECIHCPNNCEIICVYKNNTLLDHWGNKCDRGSAKVS